MPSEMNQQIVVGHQFFQKELNGYANWKEAFIREFIQNSLDAQSTCLDFSFTEATSIYDGCPVGLFRLSDNGKGMTSDVLNSIYFNLGASNKKDNDIGGFGRARIMTCFAHHGYQIVTLDNYISGRGGQYQQSLLSQMPPSSPVFAMETPSFPMWGTNANHKNNYQKAAVEGCHVLVEIQLGSEYDQTFSFLREQFNNALQKFIHLSHLPEEIKITWNNQLLKIEPSIFTKKTDHRFNLYTKNGELFAIAGHVPVTKENRNQSKYMLIRCQGALMWKETLFGADDPHQVIIELTPDMARTVMTSNRDGFRNDSSCAEAVATMLTHLNTENELFSNAKKNNQVFWVTGGLGSKNNYTINLEQKDIDLKQEETAPEYLPPSEHNHTFMYTISDREWVQSNLNVLKMMAKDIIRVFATGKTNIPWLPEEKSLFSWAQNYLNNDIDSSKPSDMTCAYLRSCYAYYERSLLQRHHQEPEECLLNGLNDMMCISEQISPSLRPLVKRWFPQGWDLPKRRGIRAVQLLTAWTAACHCILDIAQKIDIDSYLQDEIKTKKLVTGFVAYGELDNDECFNDKALIKALCDISLTHNNEKYYGLFLNPFKYNDNTKGWEIAYDLTDKKFKQYMLQMACHEVAHLMYQNHGQSFSYLQDRLLTEADFSERGPHYQHIEQQIKKITSEIKALPDVLLTEKLTPVFHTVYQEWINHCGSGFDFNNKNSDIKDANLMPNVSF